MHVMTNKIWHHVRKAVERVWARKKERQTSSLLFESDNKTVKPLIIEVTGQLKTPTIHLYQIIGIKPHYHLLLIYLVATIMIRKTF